MTTDPGTQQTEDEPIYRVDELAFEVWLWKASRSSKDTAKMLKELDVFNLDGTEITPKQISRWAREYHWSMRGNETIRQLAPSVHAETAGGMIVAGLKAQRLLDRMLEDYQERRMPPPKEAIQMVDLALRYSGMSPMGVKDPTEKVRIRGGVSSTVSRRYLDDDDMRAFEAEAADPIELPEHSMTESTE